MNRELDTALVKLQTHLCEKDDNAGLKLFDAVRQAIKSNDDVEKILLYAADCEAATAEGYALRKSASKYERKRHGNICLALEAMIRTGYFSGSTIYSGVDYKQRVLDRLTGAFRACRDKAEEIRG
jgi:hypothetical protein